MKIVNLKTFRALPPNTVFAKYEPCVFEELEIKGETWEHDFLVTSSLSSAIKCSGSAEFVDLLNRAEKTGESLTMDFDIQGRDGCFENDKLFAVWEEADVRALIERLKLCLPNDIGSATPNRDMSNPNPQDKPEAQQALAASTCSASGLDNITEIRRLRDALRRLEREICTNPTPEKLDLQLEIITEALE